MIIYDWFIGDNIKLTINSGVNKGDNEINQFIPGTSTPLTNTNVNINYWQFYRNAVTNELSIMFSSTNSCTGYNYLYSRRIYITANIEVFRAENTIIFETEPTNALPNLFYENELSFAIDENGNHEGNIQNQAIDSNIPAIIDTNFFNCFAFGNGAESYKIRDSIIGNSFNFGQRVTTVTIQDYKEADRFSDITYSGIYNGETNINKLNEFNSGLSNFKHCETSFGEIQLLDGRNTDVLTLQEDKISYVLAGKNLLSDAAVGGIISATPEVLGTQIARTEKYGISFNPESYIQWGYDRYFTDAKRGTVIQLRGGETQNEELSVVSNNNMRTWFRDMFNTSFNTQKLGCFDPYMNEYILSSNDILLPINAKCVGCGISQTFTLSTSVAHETKQEVYCVDLGSVVGQTQINWVFSNIEAGTGGLKVSVNYNGVITTSTVTKVNGSISFNKNNVSIQTAQITLEYNLDMVVAVLANCCVPESMTIIEVVVTNDEQSGQTIHSQYRYTSGTFIGPLLSNLVLFESGTNNPLVSRYNVTLGNVGTGGFPPQGSTMILSSNQIPPDNYVFNPSQNKFRYLRSSTLYTNTTSQINSLLSASTVATPITGVSPLYSANFTVPASSSGQYLYLIWDLRSSIAQSLCYASTSIFDGCCHCTTSTYYTSSSFSTATSIFTNSSLTTFAANGFYSQAGIVRQLVDGVLLPQQTCNCTTYSFVGQQGTVTCSGGTTGFTSSGSITLYASVSVLAVDVDLYTDAALTTLTTISGFRKGVSVYSITSGAIDMISSIGSPC